VLVVIALATALAHLKQFEHRWLTLAATAEVVGAGLFGRYTRERQSDWFNQRTFLTRAVERGVDTVALRMQLGEFDWLKAALISAGALQQRFSASRTTRWRTSASPPPPHGSGASKPRRLLYSALRTTRMHGLSPCSCALGSSAWQSVTRSRRSSKPRRLHRLGGRCKSGICSPWRSMTSQVRSRS
jgi:hypothetical protein